MTAIVKQKDQAARTGSYESLNTEEGKAASSVLTERRKVNKRQMKWKSHEQTRKSSGKK